MELTDKGEEKSTNKKPRREKIQNKNALELVIKNDKPNYGQKPSVKFDLKGVDNKIKSRVLV